MGWDGFAVTPDGEDLEKGPPLPGRYEREIKDPVLNAAFKKASKEVLDYGGTFVDGFLDDGALDLSNSAVWLERLTGISAYTDYPSWTIKRIVAERSADWDRLYSAKERCPCNCGCECGKAQTIDKAEMSYYLSARKFLEVCAAHGLGMRASF